MPNQNPPPPPHVDTSPRYRLGNFNVAAGQTGSINIDVTSFINSQIALNDPRHFAGFIVFLNPNQFLATDRIQFGQSSTSPFVIPTLDIGEVPLPSALPLFATGLGALGLLGWRRKRKALAA